MIAKWIIIGWMAFGTLMVIATIGKPRKTMTPGMAAAITLVSAAQIVAMVIWWRA